MHVIEVTSQPCMLCGRGNTPNGDDGTRPTFVDLERDVNWNDPAILCEDCAVQVGAQVGMLSPDDMRSHENEVKKLSKKIHALKAEVDALHRRARRVRSAA